MGTCIVHQGKYLDQSSVFNIEAALVDLLVLQAAKKVLLTAKSTFSDTIYQHRFDVNIDTNDTHSVLMTDLPM